jgi:hypothetical protein
MPIGRGFQENLRLDEGVNANGVRTILHWEGDEFITQRQQDMELALQHVQEMRERNANKKKGEAMEIGHIPWLFMEQFDAIPDPDDRRKAMFRWLRENPAFLAHPGYLKG